MNNLTEQIQQLEEKINLDKQVLLKLKEKKEDEFSYKGSENRQYKVVSLSNNHFELRNSISCSYDYLQINKDDIDGIINLLKKMKS